MAGFTLFLAMIQVTLGVIVRVTDSGLACPDWPLCHGKLVPEFDFNILLEYTHRLSAALLMLTIFSTTFITYKILKHNKIAIFAVTGATITVICAAILGGITVISKLDWWSVPSHLALAEILILFLSISNTAIWFGDFNDHSIWKNLLIKHRIMLSTTLFSIFILIVYGALMVAKGYGSSCGTWPLCNGELIPTRLPMIINAFHRFLTLAVFGLLFHSLIRIPSGESKMKMFFIICVAIYLIQILVGWEIISRGFSPTLKSIHFVLATGIWVSFSLAVGTALTQKINISKNINQSENT
jgi:heme A synthase